MRTGPAPASRCPDALSIGRGPGMPFGLVQHVLLACPIVLKSYSQQALYQLLAGTRTRRGWDFSGMNVLRQPVPWEYRDVVVRYLRSSDVVLDIDTGGGETLSDLARSFGHGLGSTLIPKWCSWRVGSRRQAISTSGSLRHRRGRPHLPRRAWLAGGFRDHREMDQSQNFLFRQARRRSGPGHASAMRR